MSSGTQETDFSDRQNTPFMIGVYLAVNAISDVYLLVDGPDCAHMKTQYVQGNHDWHSTLTDISGFHRVANTAAHPFHMASSREEKLVGLLRRMAAFERAGAVLVCPLPMAAITGVDYDRLAGLAAGSEGCPILHVPGRSLSGDWLSGYALTQQVLASWVAETKTPDPKEDSVAIVGYLWDRNEGDHEANLADIKRIIAGLGLKLVSTWLSGSPLRELEEVSKASTLISLPYGRRAARTLCRGLGIPLVEADLPFGLDGTVRFVNAVAEATGKEQAAKALIDDELTRVAPKLTWVVPAVFLHRTVSFVGDPHLLKGFLDFTHELGCQHGPMVVTARQGHAPELAGEHPDLSIAFEPTRDSMTRFLGEPMAEGAIDLLVANSFGADFFGGHTPVAEFGYPSFFTHALYSRPFLGFDGALAFADRMANALRRIDFLRMGRGGSTP